MIDNVSMTLLLPRFYLNTPKKIIGAVVDLIVNILDAFAGEMIIRVRSRKRLCRAMVR